MIKHKIIETPKARVLLLGNLPKVEEFSLYEEDEPYVLYWDYEYDGGEVTFERYDLPPGNWQYLGPLSDIPEDVADKIVDKVLIDKWRNYNAPNYMEYLLDRATESLKSLVEANVKLENKYGEEPVYSGNGDNKAVADFYIKSIQWRDEEAEVFRNPVLFVDYK